MDSNARVSFKKSELDHLINHLSNYEFKIYMHIYSEARGHTCRGVPCNEKTISIYTRISENEVGQYLDSLARAGFIEVYVTGRQMLKVQLVDPEKWSNNE